MSRRSMQLEGKLRETADREAHIRAQMQARPSGLPPSGAGSERPSPAPYAPLSPSGPLLRICCAPRPLASA